MLGFLVLAFIYLFVLLARNSEKRARSSLVRSLFMAVAFLGVLSLFSVVTLGVLFLFLLFIPFFLFPSNKSHRRFHFHRYENKEGFENFFDEMRKGYRQQRGDHTGQQGRSTVGSGMSVSEASRILGVSVNATQLQVKSAYRKLMMKHHPDKGGSAEFAAKLNTARDVMLSHTAKA